MNNIDKQDYLDEGLQVTNIFIPEELYADNYAMKYYNSVIRQLVKENIIADELLTMEFLDIDCIDEYSNIID